MAEIKLVRVDYRLIHGQVVARWLKVCPVRRIVLVDDVLGNDEFMSDIYKMAVPKGTDVDIVTIDKAKEVLDNTDDTVFRQHGHLKFEVVNPKKETVKVK